MYGLRTKRKRQTKRNEKQKDGNRGGALTGAAFAFQERRCAKYGQSAVIPRA
nr:MAG TPA: hypothetical protein [Caudoviricetes sp.]